MGIFEWSVEERLQQGNPVSMFTLDMSMTARCGKRFAINLRDCNCNIFHDYHGKEQALQSTTDKLFEKC